jgi:hypothetical protein
MNNREIQFVKSWSASPDFGFQSRSPCPCIAPSPNFNVAESCIIIAHNSFGTDIRLLFDRRCALKRKENQLRQQPNIEIEGEGGQLVINPRKENLMQPGVVKSSFPIIHPSHRPILGAYPQS